MKDMNLKRFLGKCKRGWEVVGLNAKPSYSQAGEDMIVSYLFHTLNISHPTYLEIGTNQPILCNNTYLFYTKGCKGVCIEPDTEMCTLIGQKRPNDTLLNIGIGLNDTPNATFFLFPGLYNGWSTFSKEEALIREKESGIFSKQVIIPLKPVNDIIRQHFTSPPNFMSLDVEGLDLDILKTLDFDNLAPDVICVETITFSITNTEEKVQDIAHFMHSKGYFTYADTHVNTIFCKKKLFNIG